MYAVEFRQVALRVYEYLKSMRKAAAALGVSAASICRWVRRLSPLPTHRPVLETELQRAALKHFVLHSIDRDASLTHQEIVSLVDNSLGLRVSRRLVASIITAAGYTRKKLRPKASTRRAEAAIDFSRRLMQTERTVVSIDESGFDCRVRPIYGYSKRGSRARATFHQGSSRTRHNLVMAVASDGCSHHTFVSQRVTGQHFASFILGLPFPCGIVLLVDNAAIHKTKDVKAAIATKGYTTLFTPPYSPEYNPIEHCFGAIKTRFYRLRFRQSNTPCVKHLAHQCVEQYLRTWHPDRLFAHLRSTCSAALGLCQST